MIKAIKGFLKKNYIRYTSDVSRFKIGIKCNYHWFGSSYGGFYVCSELIHKDSIVYSFGIGEDISFDLALIKKFKCKVFGFDPTPKSIGWVESQKLPKNFTFNKFGIGSKTETVQFFLPKNIHHVSGSIIPQKNVSNKDYIDVQMKSFSDIISLYNYRKIDVLKMDIEGAEYDVIDSILEAEIEIDQILIEFHDRFFNDGNEKSKSTIEHLKLRGYEIFAISNSFEEISFIKKNVRQ